MALSETRTVQRYPLDASSLDGIRSLQSDHAPDLLAQLIDLYLEDVLAVLDGLRAAIDAGDGAMITLMAHRLKGSSASFGAMTLADMCGELEELGRAGITRGAAERLVRLEREYLRVKRALLFEKIAQPAFRSLPHR